MTDIEYDELQWHCVCDYIQARAVQWDDRYHDSYQHEFAEMLNDVICDEPIDQKEIALAIAEEYRSISEEQQDAIFAQNQAARKRRSGGNSY